MRLIDADKLYPDCMTKYGRLAISQSQLANAPTVDVNEITAFNSGYLLGKLVEERPQGEWINREHYQVDEDGYDTMTCNKCGVSVDLPICDIYDFCPNCGADMRKGDDKNDT